MPNTKRGFGGVGVIIVILIALGVGAYFWNQKPTPIIESSINELVTTTNGSPTSMHDSEYDYLKTLQLIAQDIAALKNDFPQLEEFSPTKNVENERLVISYGYHTHQAEGHGGWTSGVPNPDDDGVWFYIDFHEADSQAQIHMQPSTIDMCLAAKRVSFLMLEGQKTKSLGVIRSYF